MALYKRSNSKNYWTKFYFEGKLIQQSTKCSNLKDAGNFEASLRHQLNFGRIELDAPKKEEEPQFPIFAEVVADFLQAPNAGRKESTRRRYVTASWALLEHFGSMRIDRIKRDDVERFIAWRTMQKKKAPARKLKKNPNAKTAAAIKPATINRELGLLRAIFNKKIDLDQMVLVHPTKNLFLKENNQQNRVVSVKEFRLYLMAASQPLKDIAVIMYRLGMRPSEVVALRKENIDWQSNKIRIFEGKTDTAKRSLEMPADVASIMRTRYDKTQNGLLFGGGKKGEGDTPIVKVTNAHNAAVERSGVEKFVLYTLRHTFASDYVASGGDLVSLAAILGHSKLDMVYRYAHATEQHQKNSLRNLDNYRNGITDEMAMRKTA